PSCRAISRLSRFNVLRPGIIQAFYEFLASIHRRAGIWSRRKHPLLVLSLVRGNIVWAFGEYLLWNNQNRHSRQHKCGKGGFYGKVMQARTRGRKAHYGSLCLKYDFPGDTVTPLAAPSTASALPATAVPLQPRSPPSVLRPPEPPRR